MILWYSASVILWYSGTAVIQCHCGTVVLVWYCCGTAVVQWHCGTMRIAHVLASFLGEAAIQTLDMQRWSNGERLDAARKLGENC